MIVERLVITSHNWLNRSSFIKTIILDHCHHSKFVLRHFQSMVPIRHYGLCQLPQKINQPWANIHTFSCTDRKINQLEEKLMMQNMNTSPPFINLSQLLLRWCLKNCFQLHTNHSTGLLLWTKWTDNSFKSWACNFQIFQ